MTQKLILFQKFYQSDTIYIISLFAKGRFAVKTFKNCLFPKSNYEWRNAIRQKIKVQFP